jgi:hypothetical protein
MPGVTAIFFVPASRWRVINEAFEIVFVKGERTTLVTLGHNSNIWKEYGYIIVWSILFIFCFAPGQFEIFYCDLMCLLW